MNTTVQRYKAAILALAAFVFAVPALVAQQQPLLPTPPAVPAPTPFPGYISLPRTVATGANKQPLDHAPTAREESIKLPLRKLIGIKDTVLLRHASAYYTIFMPQSARFQMKTCTLHLEFTNSIALLTERSVIRVVINDVIVAQYYLDRGKPFSTVDLPIPLALLKTGFNRVQFVVAQHYTYECEDPAAPELYTEINPDKTYFTASGEWKEIPQRLSFLRWWVDEKLWAPYSFNICMPGASSPSDVNLSWGATVTEGIALALNNQAFRVSSAPALRPGMDNIVIGTANELSGFLTATEIGAINGSFLAIKTLPGDPAHCMIIVSGRNEQEVSQTALALGMVNYPLPDSQYAIVDQMRLPDKPSYIRNAPLNLPGLYSFHQLGFKSETVQGWHTGRFTVKAYMPGDISQDDQSNAELRLHFAYGAGLRKDSVFSVFVNNQFQTAIRLNDQNGSMHQDHRLYLPMKAFQPGLNNVDLVPEMVPVYSGNCEIVQDENLLFTLYDDSDFVLPNAMHKARLPSLGLFSQTTYPYSSLPDGSETAVFVADKDADTMCAAWTILGKMAQVSGALMYKTEISFRAPRGKKSLLVIGARDQIPTDLVAKAPVSPLQVGRMRYVVSTSPKPEKLAVTPVEEFIQKIRGIPAERSEPEAPSTAQFNLTSDLVEDTVAIQFESPYQAGYPVTLITATDGAHLLAGANALQDRSVWDNLAGDLAVWNATPDSLAVAKVGPDFIYKASSLVLRVGSNFDKQPALFAIILVGLLILIALAIRAVLRRREITRGPHNNQK